MKKYKELLLGLLVIVAGVLYWIFGYDKPEPIDRPEPGTPPVEAPARPAAVSAHPCRCATSAYGQLGSL